MTDLYQCHADKGCGKIFEEPAIDGCMMFCPICGSGHFHNISPEAEPKAPVERLRELFNTFKQTA